MKGLRVAGLILAIVLSAAISVPVGSGAAGPAPGAVAAKKCKKKAKKKGEYAAAGKKAKCKKKKKKPTPPPDSDGDGDGVPDADDPCPNEAGPTSNRGCETRPLFSGGGGDSGAFHADCEYSHSAPDDPIVSPGQPGAAHEHDFIGSRNLNAFSTNESIRTDPSTCIRTGGSHTTTDTDADKSAYWVPALYVNGQAVRPDLAGTPSSGDLADMNAYYLINRHRPAPGAVAAKKCKKKAKKKGEYAAAGKKAKCKKKKKKKPTPRPGNVQPFPAGYRVIAGIATGGPQFVNNLPVWEWSCVGGVSQAASNGGFPLCGTSIVLRLWFPDCFDGRLDSPNHRDHAAYSVDVGGDTRACPTSHPLELPQLMTKFNYPTRAGSTARLSVGSGLQSESHGDFMNGWDQAKLKQLVDDCINLNRYCGGADAPGPGHP